MSANNQIWIRETKGRYTVHDQDVDSAYGKLLTTTNTLEEAIDAANDYMMTNEVEYGLRIIKEVK
ncbi:MAG: hypothetical protein ACYDBV_08695 [Nitrospiria bacterium]